METHTFTELNKRIRLLVWLQKGIRTFTISEIRNKDYLVVTPFFIDIFNCLLVRRELRKFKTMHFNQLLKSISLWNKQLGNFSKYRIFNDSFVCPLSITCCMRIMFLFTFETYKISISSLNIFYNDLYHILIFKCTFNNCLLFIN